ncbi:flagellar assembly protein FliW [Cytobacillus spongiae]|uniref:flagellar assembly protein FliW n=1 Tax=Cytobacillus spongiae TaxID=2901381 RepID=UPI001F474FA1|nr:flagellar assembly protein FliW [Cytobacillus spongiae]UII55613.1 flagellar assembly protein FliW [Cytobacillus spongiae]
MIIETKYHGKLEIEPNTIITFESGIPSFEEEKRFIVLELNDDTPFFVLQSTQTPELAFLLINPFAYFQSYEFSLPEQILEKLKIDNKEDIATFSILTIKEPFDETTANLKGPIIINTKEKLGKQLLLVEEIYQTKHKLFEKSPSQGEEQE